MIIAHGRHNPTSRSLVPGALGDPVLVLYSGATPIRVNDNWQSDSTAGQLQAIGYQPAHPQEAAFLITLNPGVYSAHLFGSGGATGIGIFEVFVP